MPFGLLDPSLALSSNRRIFSLQRSRFRSIRVTKKLLFQFSFFSFFLFSTCFRMRRGVVGSTKRREGRREIRIYISIIWDDSENGSRASFFPYPLRLRNFILFFLSRERNGGKLDVKIAIEGTCLYVDVNGEFSWALGNFEIERSANDRLLGFRFTRLPARLQTHGARFKCYSTPRTVAGTWQTLRYAATGPSLP